MAGCGCGKNCACVVQVDNDVDGRAPLAITGTGAVGDPFKVKFKGLRVTDTSVIDLTVAYDGNNGYSISGTLASTSKLDDLGDVVSTAPANGQVLAWSSANNRWQPAGPTTAASGSVSHDNSLTGDGSSTTPLSVATRTNSRISKTTTGLDLTDATFNELVRHYADATARSNATPAPSTNAFSMLDTAPGRVDYWNGSTWKPLVIVQNVTGTAHKQQSGAYSGQPISRLVKQISVGTDTNGKFEVLSAADVSGVAGILSVHIQPKATPGWVAVLTDPSLDSGSITATAYAVNGSGPMGNVTVRAVVTADLY